MIPRIGVCFFLAFITWPMSLVHANGSQPERYYQATWCTDHHGQAEVHLPDGTRADCITETHAIEFDFGHKWAEAIGQALYYGLQTGKAPGVVLILDGEKDYRHWLRLNSTIQHYKLPIETWKMER
jgi:hypothetical protein